MVAVAVWLTWRILLHALTGQVMISENVYIKYWHTDSWWTEQFESSQKYKRCTFLHHIYGYSLMIRWKWYVSTVNFPTKLIAMCLVRWSSSDIYCNAIYFIHEIVLHLIHVTCICILITWLRALLNVCSFNMMYDESNHVGSKNYCAVSRVNRWAHVS